MNEPDETPADEAGVADESHESLKDEMPGVGRRLLKGLSAFLLIALMVGGGHLLLRLEPRYLPVRVISVEGEVKRLPLHLLQETVSDRLDGGILTQDLATIKAVIEELAWVHTAGVRRIWPDRLVLSVYEHEPIARWGVDGLVTAEGIVFRPHPDELPDGLPWLDGRDEQAPLVTGRFIDWQPRFAHRGLSIVGIELDARGAWTLHTDAGFPVTLGTDRSERRVERFLRAYPYIADAGQPARVDMRYSNGLAVSWQGARTAARREGKPRSAIRDPQLSSALDPRSSRS